MSQNFLAKTGRFLADLDEIRPFLGENSANFWEKRTVAGFS
jgi:hypothetical protein